MQLGKKLSHTFRSATLAFGVSVTLAAAAAGLTGCSTSSGASNSATLSAIDQTSSSGSASSASSDSSSSSFDYSSGISDDGTWEGVDASAYVSVCDYGSIEVPASAVDVSDAVSSQIDAITSSYATTSKVTDRAVQDGDTVNIDYVGTIDGVEFDGGSTQGNGTTVTIGVTNYIDGFLDQLVGHTPGETFDVNVTFPDDYSDSDLAGKDAVFSVTINYISESTSPDVTDSWVNDNLKSSYGWSTVNDMKSAITSSLYSNALGSYITEYLVDNSDFSGDLPASMTDYQVNSMLNYYTQIASMYGMSLDEALPMITGMSSVDEVTAANNATIEKNVKSYLIIQRIAEEQGITVSDDEVQQYLEQMSGASVDMSAYESQYGMPYLRFVTLVNKVLTYLEDNAAVVDDASLSSAQEAGSTTASKSSGSKALSEGSSSAVDGEVGGTGSTASSSSADASADAGASSSFEAGSTANRTDSSSSATSLASE